LNKLDRFEPKISNAKAIFALKSRALKAKPHKCGEKDINTMAKQKRAGS
jgi:hypothetical protein